MIRNSKRAFVVGVIFGGIAPIIGLFMGTQVSVTIGNILMFPFIIISMIIDRPFGEFPTILWALGFILSAFVWGLLFYGIARLMNKQ